MNFANKTEIAITGMGLVSALGSDPVLYYEQMKSGASPIQAIELPGLGSENRIWCAPVCNVQLPSWFNERLLDGTDVVSQWALAAADKAVLQSGIQLDPLRTAVVAGTSLCGVQSVMRAQHAIDCLGPESFPRKTMLKALTNMAAAQICMHYELHGPNLTVTTACASTLDALGTAARMIQSDLCDTAIAGATEAGEMLESGGMDGSFVPSMAYAPASFGMQSPVDEARLASMPFDIKRSGVVGSEGSAFFVLERADLARARGTKIFGLLSGYASLADAHHPSAPEPSGKWEARTMQLALENAGIEPDSIDALIAHGTATPKGDSAEIRAINSVHKRSGKALPVTSTKGHFGHAAAASGGMSLIAGLMGMDDSTFIHTANTDEPDPEARFDIVINNPRDLEIRHLQINAFGFGGQNASIVVSQA